MRKGIVSYALALRSLLASPAGFFLLSYVLMTYCFEVCFHYKGGNGSLVNFFLGSVREYNDFTSYTSVLGTELPSLLYTWLGGKNYGTSAVLYNLGHTAHAFLPVLYLAHQRMAHPSLDGWTRRSLSYYVLSLLTLRAFTYRTLVFNEQFAFSLLWVLIFAYQTQKRGLGESENHRNFIWTLALLSLFSHPVSSVVFVFLAVDASRRKMPDPRNWSRLFSVLALVSVGLYGLYLYLTPVEYYMLLGPRNFRPNPTTLFLFLSFISLLSLRVFFPVQNYALALILISSIVSELLFTHWQASNGRMYGLVIALGLQGVYLFAFDRIGRSLETAYVGSVVPLLILYLSTFFYQGLIYKLYHNKVHRTAASQTGYLDHLQTARLLDARWDFMVGQSHLRSLSLHLQLARDNRISSVLSSKPNASADDVGFWGNDRFQRLFSKKEIELASDFEIRPEREPIIIMGGNLP